ncbi:MAG: response regulator transcription factor [Chloroflexia bacterium]|nr:response regulator transcription factor [Chloroflexia bacterium]
MKILLVHWDRKKGRGLRQALQSMGHAVMLASNDEALQQLLRRRPDLILVAPELIEIEGRQLFGSEAKRPFPLLLPLPPTADAPTESEQPAEQTVCTPEHVRTAKLVVRRLRHLMRKESSRLKVGDLSIFFDEKHVTFHQQALLLTPLQFKLLGTLALNAGRVLSPKELLESVWGYEADDAEARELLKVHIRRLRQKMHNISSEGSRYIQAVRGFGYRLSPPPKS